MGSFNGNYAKNTKKKDHLQTIYSFSKSIFPAPQIGQVQSSGNSRNEVPGAIPEIGSPFSSSYS